MPISVPTLAQQLSPLILSADSFTLPNDGSFAQPLSTQLLNPNRTPMLVDEFRLAGCGFLTDEVFADILLDIKLGSTPLTNGETPVRSFMPTYTRQLTVSGLGTGVNTPLRPDAQLTWHLPRPMYVPPNVQLHVKARRRLPTGFVVRDPNRPWIFTVAGRSVPSTAPIPKQIQVPWATAMHVFSNTTAPITSSDGIVNPHDEPLNMSYMCGYSCFSSTSGINRAGPTVQATFSNNKLLIRDPTPFNALFPPDRPVLRLAGLMQPKQFATVVLDLPNPTATYPNLVFTTIGLVGWRSIDTPRGSDADANAAKFTYQRKF